MFGDRIRAMGAPHWLALFGLILAAWGALFILAVPAEMRGLAAIYGADFWRDFCVLTPDVAGFWRMFAMWVLMAGAMMAPTVLPAVATYEDLGHTGATGATNMAGLLGGYLSVWVGFSLTIVRQMWRMMVW